VKLSAVHTNEGRLFQTVEAQHENRRAAMFVDEDCVDSRSDVDDLRTRDIPMSSLRPHVPVCVHMYEPHVGSGAL